MILWNKTNDLILSWAFDHYEWDRNSQFTPLHSRSMSADWCALLEGTNYKNHTSSLRSVHSPNHSELCRLIISRYLVLSTGAWSLESAPRIQTNTSESWRNQAPILSLARRPLPSEPTMLRLAGLLLCVTSFLSTSSLGKRFFWSLKIYIYITFTLGCMFLLVCLLFKANKYFQI